VSSDTPMPEILYAGNKDQTLITKYSYMQKHFHGTRSSCIFSYFNWRLDIFGKSGYAKQYIRQQYFPQLRVCRVWPCHIDLTLAYALINSSDTSDPLARFFLNQSCHNHYANWLMNSLKPSFELCENLRKTSWKQLHQQKFNWQKTAWRQTILIYTVFGKQPTKIYFFLKDKKLQIFLYFPSIVFEPYFCVFWHKDGRKVCWGNVIKQPCI